MARWPRFFFAGALCLVLNAEEPRYLIASGRADGPTGVELLLLRDARTGMEAAIAPSRGGELSGLSIRHNGVATELIYLARDYSPRPGFNGKAMFLWPTTGPVPGNRWTSGGRSYPMAFHGFAKDAAWETVEHRASGQAAWATLRLRDSEESRRSYPFAFAVTVTYRLTAGRLSIEYGVEAGRRNSGAMPFAIGNHVAFKLLSNETAFETNCRDEIVRDKASLPTGEVRPWRFARVTPLRDIHAIPAISLTNCGAEAMVRIEDPGGVAIDVRHRPATLPKMPVVQFNLYGAVSEGYFSPEPWVGLQGALTRDQGLTRVAPGKRWRWLITIIPTTSER
jgi:galactose mutarotase-like enzyme